MKFKHFSIEEREKIQELLWQKTSVRGIAKTLGRSPSSVAREINRNIPLQRSYKPRVAEERALEKRKCRGRKLRLKNGFIRRYVVTHLKEGYSPEQIAGRIKFEGKGTVSHEAIYQYIYSLVHRDGHGEMRKAYHDLRPYLKRRHKRRAKKGMRKRQRVWRPYGHSIDKRPKIVERRSRVGDWETDSVESKNHLPGLNTLVERKTGYVCITRLLSRSAEATRETIARRLLSFPAFTVTADNGPENAEWQELEAKAGVSCYRAHPYHSWERGTNENTNGLIRWYFPKGTDFRIISDEEIARVELALNCRPRKRLGWKTPLEAMSVALTG